MNPEFKPGDVVRLKGSLQILLTVGEVDSYQKVQVWWFYEGQIYGTWVPAACLQKGEEVK